MGFAMLPQLAATSRTPNLAVPFISQSGNPARTPSWRQGLIAVITQIIQLGVLQRSAESSLVAAITAVTRALASTGAGYRVSPGSWPDFAPIAESERVAERKVRCG
jgi:hypothetical protein